MRRDSVERQASDYDAWCMLPANAPSSVLDPRSKLNCEKWEQKHYLLPFTCYRLMYHRGRPSTPGQGRPHLVFPHEATKGDTFLPNTTPTDSLGRSISTSFFELYLLAISPFCLAGNDRLAPPDKLRRLVLLRVLLDHGFVVTVLDDAALEDELSLAYRPSFLETTSVHRAILMASNVSLGVRHRPSFCTKPFIGKPSFTSKRSDSRVDTKIIAVEIQPVPIGTYTAVHLLLHSDMIYSQKGFHFSSHAFRSSGFPNFTAQTNHSIFWCMRVND